MLRGHEAGEIFAAVFFEAGWNWAGRVEHDAGFFAACGCCDAFEWQEAACGAFPARRCRRIEYCRAVCGAELLPDAADDRDSCAEARDRGHGCRSGRIFWIAPRIGGVGAAVPEEPVGDCARGGIA